MNKCEVDGEDQDWLYLFKNETHNHPNRDRAFGGAATCIGGAIRDPLSGRSYVYQAMRVTGAADPLAPVSETLPGKLPQRKLVTTAAAGYSSYGNQIGLATGQVDELYHPGYAAKRMEIGAVVGAAPAENVRRETPAPATWWCCWAAAPAATAAAGHRFFQGAQAGEPGELRRRGTKGNAPVERKLQRLFRGREATRLIKRCNDFGAGGVSGGHRRAGRRACHRPGPGAQKYDGLDGTELAISESQERMAVVLAPGDVEEFTGPGPRGNLEATTGCHGHREAPRLTMSWRGEVIVDVSRDFFELQRRGKARKRAGVRLPAPMNPSGRAGAGAKSSPAL